MPIRSQAMRGFMGMSKSPAGRAKLRAHGKTPAPVSVANEFLKSSKGVSNKKLPRHVRKKK